MATQGGMGVVLKITVAASLTAITRVEDVEYPEFVKFLAETTAHGSTGGYYEAVATGKRRVQPFPATLTWDVAEATHAAIRTAFASDAPVAMSIQDPDGTEVITFDAHIEKIGRTSKQTEAYRAKVTIHPTGQPTITP